MRKLKKKEQGVISENKSSQDIFSVKTVTSLEWKWEVIKGKFFKIIYCIRMRFNFWQYCHFYTLPNGQYYKWKTLIIGHKKAITTTKWQNLLVCKRFKRTKVWIFD